MAGKPVAAAILAGGRARRLGGATKSTLVIDGLRIIDRQIAVLRQFTDPIFVVGGNPETFAPFGLQVVPDAVPDCCALGGIYTAIVSSPRERPLVVAGDMPGLTAPRVARRVRDSAADLVVGRGERGYEPLCAVYGSRCAAPIRRRLEARELRAAVLPEGITIEELGPEALAACDPGGLLFVNVNTPHDYERARNLIESMPQQRRDRITDEHSPS